MVHALLMLPVLAVGAPRQSEVIASVRANSIVYELRSYIFVNRSNASALSQEGQVAGPVNPPGPPGDSSSNIEIKHELLAKRTSDLRLLWRAYVEPEAHTLFLAGPIVVTTSCFSGAYIECTAQAFNIKTGQQRWQTYGALTAKNQQYMLMLDLFLIRDDEIGSLFRKYRVVKLPGGYIKTFNLRIPPREKCKGLVELLKVRRFSINELVVEFQDSCGTFVKTIR